MSELFDKADEMVNKRYQDCNVSIKEKNSYRDGYIHGMTEKLEGMVSIDKVCEILKNVTVTYNRRFFGKCEENAFNDDFIKEIRQLLEE